MKNSKHFSENGFCVVRRALYPDICGISCRYAFYDEAANFSDDKMSPGSHGKYADFLMESLLVHMQSKVEKNTGLELYPTYSYYRVYRPGATLDLHKDRESSEIVASVLLGYNLISWPIYIENHKIVLKTGDMVIYRGMDMEHHREVFDAPQACYQVQAFLSYVDKNGPYADYKYDKRSDLAQPWQGQGRN